MPSNIIALVDMDCFYVQVEERLNTELRGKPAAVVQYNTWKGGGIIAVNYEARARGVTRFMRGDEAKEKCPEIVLVRVAEVRGKADLTKYRDAGNEVLDVICKFCSCVQRASVDEAYLDLTKEVDRRLASEESPGDLLASLSLPNTFVVCYSEDGNNEEDTRSEGTEKWLKGLWNASNDPDGVRLAIGAAIVEEMRKAVFNATTFKCSAGISSSKVLSKLACGLHKPNRQTVLPYAAVTEIFDRLPVHKVRSLGGKLGATLVEELGCKVMGDLRNFSENELQHRFDEKTGSVLFNLARGIDNDPVVPRLIAKSIGCCKKFPGKNALSTKADVSFWMLELASEMGERLSKDMSENKRKACVLTVHIQQDLPNGSSSVSSSRSGPLTSYEPAKISADAVKLISKTNTAPENTEAWFPALKFLGLSAGKFVQDKLGRTSSIQKFFSYSKSSFDDQCPSSKTLNPEEEEFRVYTSTKHDENDRINCENQPSTSVEVPSESNEEDDSFLLGSPQQCPRCPALIPVALLPEHLDHHFAEDLHAVLNSNQSVVNNEDMGANSAQGEAAKIQPRVVVNKRKRGKGVVGKLDRTIKTRKIVDFFVPNEKRNGS